MQESFAHTRVVVGPAVVYLYALPDVLAREAAGFFYSSFVRWAPARLRMLMFFPS